MIDERSEDRGWTEHYAVQAERERQERRTATMDKFTVTVLKHEDEHIFEDIVAFEIKDNCYCMIDDTERRYIVPMSGDIMWIETVKQ